MDFLIPIVIPIAICVVLPVMVVWLVCRTRINFDNRRSEVIMEAIRNNNEVDAERLTEALRPPRKTERQILQGRLLRGCIFSLVGVALLIAALITGFQIGWETDGFGVLGVFGGISVAIGVSYLVVFAVGKRWLEENKD